MSNDKSFVIKNGLTVGSTPVIDPSGVWIGSHANITGFTGSQGVIGFTGSQGLPGINITGFTGSRGATGFTGSQGPTTTLASLGITATAQQINPLAGNFAIGNSILLRENANRAPRVEDYGNAAWWKNSLTGSDVAATKLQAGFDAQGPFVDYRLVGTPSSDDGIYGLLTFDFVDAVAGQQWTASANLQRIAGSWAGVRNFGVAANQHNASQGWTADTTANWIMAGNDGPTTVSATTTMAASRPFVSITVSFEFTAGVPVDATFRIRGVQLDQGPVRRDYRYLPATPAQVRTALAIEPAGLIGTFAMQTPPVGWLKANGALVSRATYPDLFAAIGTTYGAGDGSTTFGLPDLRGEFVRGWDDGRGVDTGRLFGSLQDDELRSHTHMQALGGGLSTVQNAAGSWVIGNQNNSFVTHTGGAETRPRNVALLACIKF